MGLRYISKIELRFVNGVDVRESEKWRMIFRFFVWVIERMGGGVIFWDEEEWRRNELGGGVG